MSSDTKVSVLIVEDSTVVRQRLRSMLIESGRVGVIAEADTEADAVRHLETSEPDMAIVDLRLRSGSGLGVLKTLKARRPACLAVVLTSLILTDLRDACLEAGAAFVLRKSEDFEYINELLSIVHSRRAMAFRDATTHEA